MGAGTAAAERKAARMLIETIEGLIKEGDDLTYQAVREIVHEVDIRLSAIDERLMEIERHLEVRM